MVTVWGGVFTFFREEGWVWFLGVLSLLFFFSTQICSDSVNVELMFDSFAGQGVLSPFRLHTRWWRFGDEDYLLSALVGVIILSFEFMYEFSRRGVFSPLRLHTRCWRPGAESFTAFTVWGDYANVVSMCETLLGGSVLPIPYAHQLVTVRGGRTSWLQC